MGSESVMRWDGDGDPDLAGWYVVTSGPNGSTDEALGPYDTEQDALDILHAPQPEDPPD
ncbi:hypothetical protein [Methylobacterium currus]|uniref:hypothetical protein n=1 Tax=Methylobacterium currus TaxID=2051553 RepID=UPI0013E0754E|nr:hypothetical protein [Methylobacterium currus]